MIKDLAILPIFNSRGELTIKVFVKTGKGVFSASSPSGKSRGKYEAKELSIKEVMKSFRKVKKGIIGMREDDYEVIDDFLKSIGGPRFSSIGGNLSIAVSIACLKAASEGKVYKFLDPLAKTFPLPLSNVMGGGVHGGFTDIQEFLVFPKKSKDILDAIKTNIEIWKEISSILKIKGFLHGRNDEGAWISRLDDYKTLDIVSNVAERHDAYVGIDVAASQLYKRGKYVYSRLGKKFDSEEQLDFIIQLARKYDLKYIEDPFHENDFKSFSELRKRIKALIVGDDLTVTNPQRTERAIRDKSINGIIIKPNQVGTISLVLETVKIAKDNKIHLIVSHRSGETIDPFIADLSVGIGSDLIKCGISGGERISKLNRLIEIWSSISSRARPRMKSLRL